MTDRILTTHVGALQRTPEAGAALLGEAPAEQLTASVDMWNQYKVSVARPMPASTSSMTASTASRSGSGT